MACSRYLANTKSFVLLCLRAVARVCQPRPAAGCSQKAGLPKLPCSRPEHILLLQWGSLRCKHTLYGRVKARRRRLLRRTKGRCRP